ncbi:MAG: hypothetical protein ACD_72C00092G0001, partial [uncultured bacterium]
PMMDTPQVIKDAAINSLQENRTHYPPVAGLAELRKVATSWMNTEFDADYNEDEVIVSSGGKFGIYLTLQSIIQPKDEVLIISPYWVSYPDMVKIFGGEPKIVKTSEKNGWKPSVNDLQNSVSKQTKMLILNNASNPTGVLYTKEEIQNILEFARKNKLVVLSDEVYSGLVYDGKKYISCASFSDYKDNVIVIQSCSKNLAMTGWRIGFVFGPKQFIKVLISLTSQSTSGVTSISQYAALAGLQNIEKIVPLINKEMQKRRDGFVSTFNTLFTTKINPPASALYCFVPMSAFGVKETDSIKFCENILQKSNVAIVPGAAFGQDGYVRCSFGGDENEVSAGLRALFAIHCKEGRM